jgi:hypothetical protein
LEAPVECARVALAESGMLEPGELADKFQRLTRATLGEHDASALYERLLRLEHEERLDLLS